MPLQFACPHCGEQTTVDDQYCGHSGPCFSCGKTVTVPHNPAARSSQAKLANGASGRRIPWLSLSIVIVAGALVAIMMGVFVMAVAIPGVQTVRQSTHRKTCHANLLRIGQALQQYHEQHGSYPPAYIPDEKGAPMHSWRVLILPQLNEMALYRSYRFDRPWDSPENLQVAAQMPAVYHCLADPDSGTQKDTSYMVVVGPRTVFPPQGKAIPYDATRWDPREETLLVVEVAGSGVGWTSPTDLQADQIRLVINPSRNAAKSLSSEHAGGINALFADGQVHWLSNLLPMEVIAAALTRDGREPFDWSQLEIE